MKQKYIKFITIFGIIILIAINSLIINCSDPKPIIICEQDKILGIYNENTSNRLRSGIDSFIGTYTGPDSNCGTIDEFIDDNNVIKEGGISKKTSLTVDGSKNQWAGWFVQWGIKGTSDSKTIDMSDYEGGNLTFWVKSPIKLEIGIRSGNVPFGTETSTVILSSDNYPPFKTDNNWYNISIPLSNFTGKAPKADLNQIKILFNVASNTLSGGTEGVQKTFWIDDIRWEKTCE
jgi:hypothetical protein